MIGKAIGQPSTQVVNIALPPAVQAGVAEVSFYAYGLGASNCCPDGKSTLDGAVLFHDTRLDDPSHKSGFVNLTNFKTTQAHALVVKLESSTGNTGSTGIALMILYDAFDAP